MFTWDSSGCMNKESVSIMDYKRHKQNARKGKLQKGIIKSGITVAQFRMEFIMQSHIFTVS